MLEVKNVFATVGNFNIVDVSFSVSDNEVVVLLGENGSGKTTLLNTIAGFVKVKDGSILLDGQDITNLPPFERNIGYIFQDLALFPHLTVEENIKYGLKFRKIKDEKEQFEYLVNFFNLRKLLKRYPETLSGGEKQKVAIARSLILDPKLILFDEPTSKLSPREREKVALTIKQTVKEFKKSAIYVTHNIEEAHIIADKIAIVENGKIIQFSTPKDIFYKPVNDSVAKIGEMNVIEGVVKAVNNGIVLVEKDGLTFEILGDYAISDAVKIFIRPEEIILSKEERKTSAQNNFKGKITGIIQKGVLVKVRVRLSNEVEVDSLITRKSFEEMALKLNDEVYLSFKITSVHSLKVD